MRPGGRPEHAIGLPHRPKGDLGAGVWLIWHI